MDSRPNNGVSASFPGADSKRRWTFVVIQVVAFLLLTVIGLLDWLTGNEVSFAVFYLGSVGVAAWYGGWIPGVQYAVFSAAAWFLADAYSAHQYSHNLIPIWNGVVRFGFFLLCALLIARLRAIGEMERQLAYTDSGTGVANARTFYRALRIEAERARRTGKPLTLLFVDLDDFKVINDRYGHVVGDQVLRDLATRLQQTIRLTDLLARVGGDEFAIILPDADETKAERVVQRLLTVECSPLEGEKPVRFTCGRATFTEILDDIPAMVRKADEAMYALKARRRRERRSEASESARIET